MLPFWSLVFCLHIPISPRRDRDLSGSRPQRNGVVDAGDKNLALKMQAWCLQREGVGGHATISGKGKGRQLEGGGWVGREGGGWNSMGIFCFCFFLVRKGFPQTKTMAGGLCVEMKVLGWFFGLMVFCFVSLRFPGFSKGFSYVFSISFVSSSMWCLRPFWDRQELNCTEHITLVINLLSFNNRSFSSCFWSGWDTTRIYNIWEYIYIYVFIICIICTIHINSYHMYLCICIYIYTHRL